MAAHKQTPDVSCVSNQITDVLLYLLKISKETNADVTLNQIKIAAENSNLCANVFQEVVKTIKLIVNKLPCSELRKSQTIIASNKRKMCVVKSNDLLKCTALQNINMSKKSYKCRKCFGHFAFKSSFRGHVHTHSSVKKLRCCKKLFSTYASFQVHVLLHSRVKSIICKLCKKTFCTHARKRIHLKSNENHHEEKTKVVRNLATVIDSNATVADSFSKETMPILESVPSHTIEIKSTNYSKNMQQDQQHKLPENYTNENKESLSVCKIFDDTHQHHVTQSNHPTKQIVHSLKQVEPPPDPGTDEFIPSKAYAIPDTRHTSFGSTLEVFNMQSGLLENVIIVGDNLDFKELQLNESGSSTSKTQINQTHLTLQIKSEKFESPYNNLDGVLQCSSSVENQSSLEGSSIIQRPSIHRNLEKSPPVVSIYNGVQHNAVEKNTCYICKVTFASEKTFNSHMRLHSDLENLFSGSDQPPSPEKQQRRIKTEPKSDQKHKCEHCDYSTDYIRCLQNHLHTHTGEKPYCCNLCSQRFTQESNLNRHLKIHEGVKNYICSHCHSGFYRYWDCMRHEASCSNSKPYACAICHRTFSFDIERLKHEKRHNGKLPYKCKYCNKLFTASGDLRKHTIRIHTKDFAHRCAVCQKGFLGQFMLRKHVLKWHPACC